MPVYCQVYLSFLHISMDGGTRFQHDITGSVFLYAVCIRRLLFSFRRDQTFPGGSPGYLTVIFWARFHSLSQTEQHSQSQYFPLLAVMSVHGLFCFSAHS